MENVAVRFGSMTITEFFDDSQREFIISQYPANLRPHLERVRNPLDINEILTAMVSSWHVKMVLKAVEDDYEVYFHARDIARSLEYGEHGVNKWRPWLVEMGFDFVREEEIKGVSGSDAPLKYIGDFTGGRQPSTQYLIADALRVVLTKINKPKAKEWAGVLCRLQKIILSFARVRGIHEGILLSSRANLSPPVVEVSPPLETEEQAGNGLALPLVINGISMEVRPSDGYINATTLCNAVSASFNDWRRRNGALSFLDTLSFETGIPVSKLVIVRKGGRANLQGTWVHPYVAINIVNWLSPGFAVRVTKWVFELLSCGDVELGRERDDEEVMRQHITNMEQMLEESRQALAESRQALAERDMRLTIISSDMERLKQSYNAMLRRRRHEKLPSGDCFYLIRNTREAVPSIKFGIAKDINKRLQTHRSTAPCTILKYLVYTPGNKLLEDIFKHRIEHLIDPAGHEVAIHGNVDELVAEARSILQFLGGAYTEASRDDIDAHNDTVPHHL